MLLNNNEKFNIKEFTCFDMKIPFIELKKDDFCPDFNNYKYVILIILSFSCILTGFLLGIFFQFIYNKNNKK